MDEKEKKMPGGRPMLQKETTYECVADGIYDIACPPVGFHCYLVVGEKKAVLVDTGMGIGSLRKVVESLTDLPVMVVLTHGHPDHGGGTAEFEEVFMWAADFDVYSKMACKEFRIKDVSHMPGGPEMVEMLQPTGPEPKPLEDGQIIDLGGRTLEVIYAPGHTHGSICLIDSKTRGMFTGDNVQGYETTIREWNSSTIDKYLETLKTLKKYEPAVLYGGHRPNINMPSQIDKFIACAEDILAGAKGEEVVSRMDGSLCQKYEKDGVAICYSQAYLM